MTDNDPLIWQLILQVFLIAVNAIFACAEIAVISINDNKLAKMAAAGDKRAIRLSTLTKQPARFLATIQVGITLAGFLGSAFAAGNFAGKLVNWMVSLGVAISPKTLETISILVITLILSYLTLVFGELIPKRVAMKKAEKLALGMSGFIYAISKIFGPLVWLLTISTNAALRIIGIDPNANDEEITEEEIRMMVDVGSEKGAIDFDERQFIHNVFELDNKTAEEVMTHRTEVVFLWLEDSDDVWKNTILENRHTIYPICDESADDIIGVLNSKDYFRLQDQTRESVMTHAVKPAQFVPEGVRTDILLRNMQKKRNHFSVVLDEFSGVSGIVTVNDLLEQLVGNLDDDDSMPQEESLIMQLDENKWCIHGTALLDDVALTLGVELPTEDYDTFGGMIFAVLGTIPDDGDTPELDEFGLHVRIKEIVEHRLETAEVSVIQEEKVETQK